MIDGLIDTMKGVAGDALGNIGMDFMTDLLGQVIDEDVPFEKHDIPVDFIVTPDEVIETKTGFKRPEGIIPDILSEEYINEIPCLSGLV